MASFNTLTSHIRKLLQSLEFWIIISTFFLSSQKHRAHSNRPSLMIYKILFNFFMFSSVKMLTVNISSLAYSCYSKIGDGDLIFFLKELTYYSMNSIHYSVIYFVLLMCCISFTKDMSLSYIGSDTHHPSPTQPSPILLSRSQPS